MNGRQYTLFDMINVLHQYGWNFRCATHVTTVALYGICGVICPGCEKISQKQADKMAVDLLWQMYLKGLVVPCDDQPNYWRMTKKGERLSTVFSGASEHVTEESLQSEMQIIQEILDNAEVESSV